MPGCIPPLRLGAGRLISAANARPVYQLAGPCTRLTPGAAVAAPARHQRDSSEIPAGSGKLPALDNRGSPSHDLRRHSAGIIRQLQRAWQWQRVRVLGQPGAQNWHPAFDQELGALKEALGQMISKILSTGARYQATEAANQSAAQRVGAAQ